MAFGRAITLLRTGDEPGSLKRLAIVDTRALVPLVAACLDDCGATACAHRAGHPRAALLELVDGDHLGVVSMSIFSSWLAAPYSLVMT